MIIITKARRTTIDIIYQGKNITKNIAPYILSFTFTDNSGGTADDITISLEDRAGTWLNDWSPAKSDIITASIVKYDGINTTTLPCGTFSIDQIDYSYPPAVMNIKAVSSAITKKASQQKHTRTWENVSLNHVISDIASANNLSLFMKAENDTTFERIDQTQQSDLDFLRTLCADEGLSVKIQAERLVVYDTEAFENASPITSLALDDERLISCRFSSKSAKVSKKAKVHYHDSYKDEDYYAEYEDDDIEGSERELEIYERVESQAHAEKLAEKRLIDANRKEITGSLTLMGDTRFAAGLTLSLNDFGMFSGNHFISKATHTINNSGYSVSLELGQPKSEKGKAKKRKGSRKKEGSASIIYYEGDKHY